MAWSRPVDEGPRLRFPLAGQIRTNLFAKGFEADRGEGGRFALVTMFEMMEHLVDPVAELQPICAQTDHLLFSTLLLPPGRPSPDSWWYFNPTHGQHVSFFTIKALEVVARRLGRHFCSDGKSCHYMGTRRVNPLLFQLAVGRAGRFLADLRDSRRSLVQKDYDELRRGPASSA